MSRRWQAGWRGTVDGVTLRVERGKKGPADLRMDVFVGGEWKPVHMSLGCVLADFFFENEDVLYPPSQGFAGGTYYLRALAEAPKVGWEAVVGRIRSERQNATVRRGAVELQASADGPVSLSDGEAELDAIMKDVPWPKAAA